MPEQEQGFGGPAAQAAPGCSRQHTDAVWLARAGQHGQSAGALWAVVSPTQHSRQSSGSSERSPQSSSVSHFHQKGMHLSFLQTNCDGETSL